MEKCIECHQTLPLCEGVARLGVSMVVVAWRCGEDKKSRNFFSAPRSGTDVIGTNKVFSIYPFQTMENLENVS